MTFTFSLLVMSLSIPRPSVPYLMAGIRQRTGRKYVSAGWQANASLEKAVSLLTVSKSFVNMVPEEIRKE
jgi:hypothetical protein